MKTCLTIFAIGFALTIATATQVRADVIFSTDPLGIVAWTDVPTDCTVSQGPGLIAKIGVGGITFGVNKFGTISVRCYVTSIMRVDPSSVNAFGVTFANINGFVGGVDHCTVSATAGAQPYASGPATLIGAFSTAGENFTALTTANASLTDFLNLDTNGYSVSITMVRNAGSTCNPKVYAAFLEEIIE